MQFNLTFILALLALTAEGTPSIQPRKYKGSKLLPTL